MMEKLSVVIITYNEEENIGRCLESVKWADEIVVVDSFSKDPTVAITTQYTDKAFQRKWTHFGDQKNYAVSKATHRWILSVDADEVVPPRLAKEILELFAAGDPPRDGYEIARKSFFGKTWVRHGGWYPDYVLRLFRKDKGRFNDRMVHEAVEIQSKPGRLSHCLEHYSYRSIDDFIERMNRYSTLSAKVYFSEGRRIGPLGVAFRAWFTFIQMFFLKKGFLDGVLGFQLAALYACYTVIKYLKLMELWKDPPVE